MDSDSIILPMGLWVYRFISLWVYRSFGDLFTAIFSLLDYLVKFIS
jgi:hypothetical protein